MESRTWELTGGRALCVSVDLMLRVIGSRGIFFEPQREREQGAEGDSFVNHGQEEGLRNRLKRFSAPLVKLERCPGLWRQD